MPLFLVAQTHAFPTTADQHQISRIRHSAGSELLSPSVDYHGAISEYRKRIIEIEDRDGVYDAALIPQFTGLGVALQQQGELEDAAETFQHALFLNRINYGFYSERHFPILKQLILTHSEAKQWDRLSRWQNQLYALQVRVYSNDGRELLPALNRMVQHYIRASEHQFTNETVLGLLKAQSLQRQGIAIVEQHYGKSDPRLVDLLYGEAIIQYRLELYRVLAAGFYKPAEEDDRRPSRVTFEEFSEPQFRKPSVTHYVAGLRALKRRLGIIEASPKADTQSRILAMLALADWHFLFKKRQRAQALYQRIYQQYGDEESSGAFITRLFEAPKPLRFSYETFDSTSKPEEPYVAARFNVSAMGNATKIEIFASELQSKQGIELKRKIRNYRFRPRLKEGEPVGSENIVYKVGIADETST